VAGNLVQVSATGDVVAGQRVLHSVVLSPAAAACSVEIRDGASGAIRLTLKAVANGASVGWAAADRSGIPFSSAIHATVAGAGALVNVEYS
jgi:hypothetical protein